MGTRLSIDRCRKIADAWMQCVGDAGANPVGVMQAAGLTTKNTRNANRYRKITEDKLGIVLPSLHPKHSIRLIQQSEHAGNYHNLAPFDCVIFSDAHWWPGQDITPAHKILLQVILDINPDVIVDNGDSLDGASISRHPAMMWEELPTLADEISICQKHLAEIEQAAPGAKLFRNLGNHDLRYEAKLAQELPEFRGVKGTKFSELFPAWDHHYSLYINGNFKVKHSFKGGLYAGINNAKAAGISHCTGHDHKLSVIPWTNETGTIYGISGGMLADINAPQFHYAQDNTRDWRPGFVVVKFDGSIHYPDCVQVVTNQAGETGRGSGAFGILK